MMSHRIPFMALISACLFAANPLYADDTLNQVQAVVDEVTPMVLEWRRDFHAHPELSNREERTANVVSRN